MEKKEISPAEAYRLLTPGCVVLVASQKSEKYNVMTASWQMPVSRKPPLVAVAIAKQHLTADYIQSTGAFTVNVPGYDILTQVHRCGTVSGRDADKFAVTGLTPVPGQKVAAPLIAECLAGIECRLWQAYDGGDHWIFVGEVLSAVVAAEHFENQWRLSGGKEGFPIHHLGGAFYFVAGTLINVAKREDEYVVFEKPVGNFLKNHWVPEM